MTRTIEAQAAEIRNLKDQIKRMEANEMMRKSWWHRLVAWFD